MIDQNWIDEILRKSKSNTLKESRNYNNPLENRLIEKLIDESYRLKKEGSIIPIGKMLAGSFDLVVSADYYSSVGHRGWFYCPSPVPSYYYHFTNCCPRHALSNIFYFHPSSKPESGSIGKSTSRLLRNFLNVLLSKRGRKEKILKGAEPVDVVVVNEENHHIFFGEIKASPLLTLPLKIEAQQLIDTDGKEIVDHDSSVTVSSVFGQQINIFIPEILDGVWQEGECLFGSRENSDDVYWGYRSLIDLLERDQDFLARYLRFWDAALTTYHPKLTESVYWLTNGCGAPNPRPDWWPKAKSGDGNGFESISDSKTSVGMDRTDDIKKGIYQILKLGSEGKPVSSKWIFKVGIVSNIHAARHFEEYLESLKNLIWTQDPSGSAKKAGDLPLNHPLYNLFDGIVALTECHFRDEWLKQVFEINNK